MCKTPQIRNAFGSCNVGKVHAVVARNIFRHQNVKNASVSEHGWKLRCWKSAALWREVRFQVNMYKTPQVRSAFEDGTHTLPRIHVGKAGGPGWNAHVHCKPRMAHIQWHTYSGTHAHWTGGVVGWMFTFTGTCKTKHGTYTRWTNTRWTDTRWTEGGVMVGCTLALRKLQPIVATCCASQCMSLQYEIDVGWHKNNKKTHHRLVFLHQDPYLELQANHRPPVVIRMVVLAGFDTVRFPALLIKYHPRKRRLEELFLAWLFRALVGLLRGDHWGSVCRPPWIPHPK